MNILVVGSGGREHAFAKSISESPKCGRLFVCPGNAGTASIAENVAISVDDFEGIKALVLKENIEMVVVGPEAPLVAGIVDFFRADESLKSVKIIGPDASGAGLEGSKDFAKAFMNDNGIPTAQSQTFDAHTLSEGLKYLESINGPYVLKADGLAAGKGVVITESLEDARQTLKEMIQESKFGSAGDKVLIEQFLSGIEVSVFVLTDGENYLILPEAKDYKRIGEGDTGLNTGGMGAVSPVPFADEAFLSKVEERVIKPTMNGLKRLEIDYKGFIFLGLMNMDGDPYVIEYNVRMGDPETEVVLPRVKNDWLELFEATANRSLNNITLDISPETAVTTVIVAGGYPENYRKGDIILLPEESADNIVFHAGTQFAKEGVLTNGGRVFAVTGLGKNLETARTLSQQKASEIKFDNSYFRKDIGLDLQIYLDK